MNKSESKYYNTACLMDEALIVLLEKKDFEYITVKELCVKAGVNRSTFYLHYETMADLLDETVFFVNREFAEYYEKDQVEIVQRISDCKPEELCFINKEYLLPYLKFVKEHKKLFAVMVKKARLFQAEQTFDKLFKYVFSPILDRFNYPEDRKRFVISFYLNGLTAVITEWIKADCEKSYDEMLEIVTGLVIPQRTI